ncbi:hypothetical protein [Streptomyces syringium]|uniref:hypothetical protein n=1 Tax=Streptomyces syringium TaxID=76729 RepID=UPI003456F8D3
MGARVSAHVYVTSKDGVQRTWLAPGDAVPSWATVDNPNVVEAADAGDSSPVSLSEPSRSGPGSGKAAWAAFADAHGVATDSEMSRDDIIAACEAADVVTTED